MPLRRVCCVDIYFVGFRFCLDIWLRLLGLRLLILCAVILIVFWCKFSRNLAIESGKFGFELPPRILLACDCTSLVEI